MQFSQWLFSSEPHTPPCCTGGVLKSFYSHYLYTLMHLYKYIYLVIPLFSYVNIVCNM